LNAKSGTQEHDHRRAAATRALIAGVAHDGHKLVDRWRLGRVADAFAAQWARGDSRHGRRRTAPPSRIKH
jgi:hypothetical protein